MTRKATGPLMRPAQGGRCIGGLGRAIVEEDVLYDRLGSGERHAVTCSHRSRRFDHGVHARAGELTGSADLNPVMSSERSEDVGVRG